MEGIRIPKAIQAKMHRAAAMYAKCAGLMEEIDGFLQSKGISPEVYRTGNGVSLEELEYGNDVTEQFVEWAEEGFT